MDCTVDKCSLGKGKGRLSMLLCSVSTVCTVSMLLCCVRRVFKVFYCVVLEEYLRYSVVLC